MQEFERICQTKKYYLIWYIILVYHLALYLLFSNWGQMYTFNKKKKKRKITF